jgi:predicted type IV restriction endonuclease
MMQSLNFPAYTFRIKTEEQRNYIFDNIRKRYVILTPEEWVRQHLATYLTEEKKYPAALMAVEMSLKINKLERRADIVLFSRDGKPFMIVECKAPGVKVTQNTFDQAARYNMDMKVEYLVISNGLVHYCARLNHADHSWEFLKEIPGFNPPALHAGD